MKQHKKLSLKQKILLKRLCLSLNIFNINRTFKQINSFDEITTFRLTNSFIVAIGFTAIVPVLTSLKGTLLLPWVIGLISIVNTISIKTNEIIVHSFSVDELYKTSVIIHIALIFSTLIYFYNPTIMIYLDSLLSIIETAFLSSYSIALNNYIAKHIPKSMSSFQINRNSIYANGSLLGLFVSTLTLYFFSIDYVIYLFLFLNIAFGIWLVNNWNFYKNKDI